MIVDGFETAEQLIRYCSLHCTTPRALFKGIHVNKMIDLADAHDEFNKIKDDSWISLHEDMEELVELAEAKLKRDKQ